MLNVLKEFCRRRVITELTPALYTYIYVYVHQQASRADRFHQEKLQETAPQGAQL